MSIDRTDPVFMTITTVDDIYRIHIPLYDSLPGHFLVSKSHQRKDPVHTALSMC